MLVVVVCLRLLGHGGGLGVSRVRQLRGLRLVSFGSEVGGYQMELSSGCG